MDAPCFGPDSRPARRGGGSSFAWVASLETATDGLRRIFAGGRPRIGAMHAPAGRPAPRASGLRRAVPCDLQTVEEIAAAPACGPSRKPLRPERPPLALATLFARNPLPRRGECDV